MYHNYMVKDIKIEKHNKFINTFYQDLFKYTSINTGLNRRDLLRLRKKDNKNMFCYCWDGKNLDKIDFNSSIEVEGEVHFYSDYLNIKSLKQSLYSKDIEATLKISYSILNILQELTMNGEELYNLTLDTIFIDDKGSIYFFNNNLCSLLKGTEYRYNHPDYKGEKQLLYFLGVSLYRAFTGIYPFIDDNHLNLKMKIRKSIYIPSNKLIKNVDSALTDFINKAICGKASSKDFSKVLKDSIGRDFSSLEKADPKPLMIKNDKKFKRIISIRKNRDKFLVLLPILFFTGLFVIFMNKGDYIDPRLIGKSDREVLGLYFSSFNTLENMLNEGCVTENVNRNDSLEILALKFSYESGGKPYIPPSAWIDYTGDDVRVFGIDNIKIVDLGENSYEVFYEKWTTESFTEGDLLDSKVVIQREFVKENFFMVFRNELWKIDRIETLSREAEVVEQR